MNVKTSLEVKDVFEKYPKQVVAQMQYLRDLILTSAGELNNIDAVEETLKWGEPSYLTKYGSTLRIDWKAKAPDQYAVYFKCTSKLVETFKLVYGNLFKYEGTRAIIFTLNEKIPEEQLKQCLKAALMYHKVKKLPLLGLA